MILRINNDYSISNINQLIFAMDKRSVFFEVGTGFLNVI
jgi:hypothetical protein